MSDLDREQLLQLARGVRPHVDELAGEDAGEVGEAIDRALSDPASSEQDVLAALMMNADVARRALVEDGIPPPGQHDELTRTNFHSLAVAMPVWECDVEGCDFVYHQVEWAEPVPSCERHDRPLRRRT